MRRRASWLTRLLIAVTLVLIVATVGNWFATRPTSRTLSQLWPGRSRSSVAHNSDGDSGGYGDGGGGGDDNSDDEAALEAVETVSARYREDIVRAVRVSSINDRCTADIVDPRYEYLRADVARRHNKNSAPYYFFALNLHNAQLVVPDLTLQLLRVFQHLGTDNVYVAVFENGSNDRTKSDLTLMDIILSTMNIHHDIIVDVSPRDEQVHRIEYLAGVRNRVLDLILDQVREDARLGERLHRVVFLNDIFICADEILELVHQSVFHQADMACALDYDQIGDQLGFYDTWVARDVDGMFFGKLPWNGFVQHEASRNRLARNQTFQAFCCWNGATVLNPAAFLPPHNIRFRREVSTMRSTEQETLYATCSGSEISLLCLDLAKHGFSRRIIVPSVKVAYTWQDYARLRPAGVTPQPHTDSEIKFQGEPERSLCFPLDGPGRHPGGQVAWEVLDLRHIDVPLNGSFAVQPSGDAKRPNRGN